MLLDAGIPEVFSMEGGIVAWDGKTATGAIDAGMDYFNVAVNLEQMVTLAIGLEEGARLFYEKIQDRFKSGRDEIELFGALANAEILHKQSLIDAYRSIAGKELVVEEHQKQLIDAGVEVVMEGGIPLTSVFTRLHENSVEDILDFAMAQEVNAYDLYIKMARKFEGEAAGKIFMTLAEEEHIHLQRLADVLDKKL